MTGSAIGRVLVDGQDAGSGFAVADDCALTAGHVVRQVTGKMLSGQPVPAVELAGPAVVCVLDDGEPFSAEAVVQYQPEGGQPIPVTRIEASTGLDVAVLYPSIGLGIMMREEMDPKLAAAIARAYNDWLHDFCQTDPKRLKGVAMLPLHDPNEAAKEADALLAIPGRSALADVMRGQVFTQQSDPAAEKASSFCCPGPRENCTRCSVNRRCH